MKLNSRVQLLFLLFVVLGVYYPAIFAGLNSVDDAKMFSDLEEMQGVSLNGLFAPGTTFYYRPLLMLTFIADYSLWGQEQSFYHLENILLHAANALLVFFLARRVFARAGLALPGLPLIAALLFALHPINTESVNWISGRTDILATFFVLLALLALLRGLEANRLRWIALSSIAFAAAICSKEMTLFFFPAFCFLLWRWPELERGDSRRRQLFMVVFAAPYLLGVVVYLSWRIALHAGHDVGYQHLMTNYHYGWFDSVRVFFKVLGFYVKKLIAPLPLNFAIRQVNDHYVWLGLVAFAVTLCMALRRSPIWMFMAVAIYQILPAIVIALVAIAWTPLAERYLYLPSAFFCISLLGLIAIALHGRQKTHLILPLCVVLLLPAAVATAHRNLLWQDNRLLYADTLQKNPDFAAAHNELGIALMDNGQQKDAEVLLKNAIQDGFGKKNPLIHVNLANVYLGRKDYALARRVLLDSFVPPAPANVEVLKMLTRVNESELLHNRSLSPDDRTALLIEMVEVCRQIYLLNKDPYQLYRSGQLLLGLKRDREAGAVFMTVAEIAPKDAFYYAAAQKLSVKLQAQAR